MEYGVITTSCILVIALAVTVQVFFFSPVSPATSSANLFTPNNHLQGTIKLGEGVVIGPEDVCVDGKGMLYTATRDGWIKRLHTNGRWENWTRVHNKDTLLGLTVTKAGDVIVCDGEQGLIKVSKDGAVTALETHMNGAKITFADDVVEAGDGSLYFSVPSIKYGFDNWDLDVREAKPDGQLRKYDPSTKETSLVLKGLGFSNGVAISMDQQFLVVCETWKCVKYWLKEETRGKVDIFIDNLPGFPDNIKLAPDGSFWIAIPQLNSSKLNFVHSSKEIKHVLATFPELFDQAKASDKGTIVLNIGSDGRIIRMLDDPNGQVVSFVSSVLEYDGNIYLGSLKNNFVGKLRVKNPV